MGGRFAYSRRGIRGFEVQKVIEVWKDIPGWEGLYQVSDAGRVRSLDRRILCDSRWGGKEYRTYKGKLLKSHKNPDGYNCIALTEARNTLGHFVHVLVALAFIGPKREGMQVCHRDGNPSNDNLSNLRYGTQKENYEDSIRHGTAAIGSRNKNSKLTEDAVRWIRQHGNDKTRVYLAAKFGVSTVTIYRIRQNQIWTHVG